MALEVGNGGKGHNEQSAGGEDAGHLFEEFPLEVVEAQDNIPRAYRQLAVGQIDGSRLEVGARCGRSLSSQGERLVCDVDEGDIEAPRGEPERIPP